MCWINKRLQISRVQVYFNQNYGCLKFENCNLGNVANFLRVNLLRLGLWFKLARHLIQRQIQPRGFLSVVSFLLVFESKPFKKAWVELQQTQPQKVQEVGQLLNFKRPPISLESTF